MKMGDGYRMQMKLNWHTWPGGVEVAYAAILTGQVNALDLRIVRYMARICLIRKIYDEARRARK